MSWNVIPAFSLDDPFGYQGANRFRENLISLVSARRQYDLGGSRAMPNMPAIGLNGELMMFSKQMELGPLNVVNFIDVEIDGTNQTGITYQARVECRIIGYGGVTVTPRVYNVTDATAAGTGSACSVANFDFGGTNQKQTIALTIASGIKKYRLQYTVSALPATTYVSGHIEAFATA